MLLCVEMPFWGRALRSNLGGWVIKATAKGAGGGGVRGCRELADCSFKQPDPRNHRPLVDHSEQLHKNAQTGNEESPSKGSSSWVSSLQPARMNFCRRTQGWLVYQGMDSLAQSRTEELTLRFVPRKRIRSALIFLPAGVHRILCLDSASSLPENVCNIDFETRD